jgi:hypothetical protein
LGRRALCNGGSCPSLSPLRRPDMTLRPTCRPSNGLRRPPWLVAPEAMDRQEHRPGHSPNDNVVLKWNDQALAAIRLLAPAPPVTARALAILNTSIYDAWTAYAAERALSNLSSFRTALGYTVAPTGQPDDPATIGVQAADAVIAARADDGSNQAGGYGDTTGYSPTSPPGPLSWQPLAGQSFIVPTGSRSPRSRSPRPTSSCPPIPGLKKSDGSYDKAVKDIIAFSAKLDDRTRRGPSTGPTASSLSSHPATGCCSPGPSPAGSATASTRTPSSTSPSATRCWMPASAPGVPSAATTSSARSPPCAPPMPAGRSGLGRAGPGDQGHPGRAVPLLRPHPAPSRLCVRA